MCVGHLLDLKGIQFSNHVHNMLLHEVITKGAEKKIWFLVRDNSVRFSHIEFRLITGLTLGLYSSDTRGFIRLRDMYFDREASMELKDLEKVYKAIDFRLIDDMDVVKLSVYMLMDMFLVGWESRYHMDMWIL